MLRRHDRITNHPVTVLAVLGALVVASSAARADVINVPIGQPTIQDAIDVAGNGDEIVAAPGTYSETIDFNGKHITLRSSHGPPGGAFVALP